MTFIPYQVDYSVQNSAKMFGFSKKKVVFKFGFANPQAAEGQTGAACRGSEHEVTFIWSLASGKRQLWLDGKDVHYSESGQNGWTADRAWQYAFNVHDNTVRQTLKVHFISQPANKDIPGSRPFDLRVGGISYFAFNQIYQLGTPSMSVRTGSNFGSSRDSVTSEERRLIELAKKESLKDYDRQLEKAAEASLKQSLPAREEASLISFDDPPAPISARGVSTDTNTSGNYVKTGPYPGYASSITLDSNFPSERGVSVGAPPPAAPAPYGAGGYGMPSAYGVPPGAANPFAAPPAAAGALTTYQAPPGAPAPSPYAMPPANPYGAPPPAAPFGAPPPYGAPPAASPFGAPAPAPYGAPAPAYGGVQAGAQYAVNTAAPSGGGASGPYTPQASSQMFSPGGQSVSSIGSPFAFAQPPRPPAPSPYGYAQSPQQPPSQATPPAGYGYAAPPPQPQNPF